MNSGFVEQFIMHPKYRIPRHIIFWLFIYMDELLSFVGVTEPFDNPTLPIIEMILDMALVYSHLYIFVPRFLAKKKYGTYFIFFLITISIVILADNYLYREYFEMEDIISHIISVLVPTSTILFTAIGIKIFKTDYENRKRLEELREVNLKNDIQILQSQVNPHFLFNALNNIYIQSRSHPEQVSDSILQLSDLMRYQTYDSQKERVLLSDELEYLKNYLLLEQKRRDNLTINFEIHHNLTGIKVAPLIFLPLIENAVKFSMRSDGHPMHIHVDVAQMQNQIQFNVENSKSNYDVNKGKPHGSGLENLKKRLSLIYDNHELTIDDQKERYICELIVPKL